MALSHSFRALLSLKSLIKEVIVSNSTVYEDNIGYTVVATSPRMNPTSKQIYVKYHWFRQHVVKKSVIQKIESENEKADIFTKGLQGKIFLRIRKLLCSW